MQITMRKPYTKLLVVFISLRQFHFFHLRQFSIILMLRFCRFFFNFSLFNVRFFFTHLFNFNYWILFFVCINYNLLVIRTQILLLINCFVLLKLIFYFLLHPFFNLKMTDIFLKQRLNLKRNGKVLFPVWVKIGFKIKDQKLNFS